MMSVALAPENDFALLERFASAGDEEAFAEIVRRYAGIVFATSFRVTRDRGRAEDVAQEVFFKLLRRPQSVNQSLGGWLHQCATRLALDDVRSEGARRKREANRRIETNELEQQATTWQELSPHVDEALATLSEESRELLVSHFLNGKSQSAIAIETRTSPATVSRRMRDAVTALRAALKRKGVFVAPALLVGLCRMNAPAQAQAVPTTLMTELGKMAIVGKPAAASFAWHSVDAWCDAAARTWDWPAEMVKRAVATAATSAVAIVAGLLIINGFVAMNRTTRPPAPTDAAVEARHVVRATPMAPTAAAARPAAAPRAKSTEVAAGMQVRVAPASERGAGKVVLFRWPQSATAPITLTYGDGRSLAVPQHLARKLIEDQSGKPLEQIAEESQKHAGPKL
jgi:RNA polymerase sigma factor (sigma-70 family)